MGSGVALIEYTCRSICELTVTDLLPVLLAVLESASVPDTLELRVIAPPAVGVTTMVTV